MDILTLSDMCDKKACEIIKKAVREERNIVITGGNDTGKSAFQRALISKVSNDRDIRVSRVETVSLLRQRYTSKNILGYKMGNLESHERATVLIDNASENYILDVLKKENCQVIAVNEILSEKIARSITVNNESAIEVVMNRDDNNKAHVVKINEINKNGERYELYTR